MDFLTYYRDNLYYIRALAAEFAAEFPKIAGRLSLSEFDCQDPYIERLLEGTAFLAAKTEKKLDDGYYGFLESILNSVAPSSVYPIPSGGVLELIFDPTGEASDSLTIKAGTLFSAAIPSINTLCRFSNIEDVTLNLCRVLTAQYLMRNLSTFNIKETDAQSALRIELSPITGDAVSSENRIGFFFNAAEADVSLLFRLLKHDTLSVYGRSDASEPFKKLEDAVFDLPLSLGGEIFEQTYRSNTRGLRLLQNYLSYSDFFKFFTLVNVKPVGEKPLAELVVFFKRREPQLLNSVTPASIKTNCIPVLNIFPKQSDRVVFNRKAYETHLVPDRTAMRDYEVVNVKKIDFYNMRNEHIFSAVNFYDEALAEDRELRNFFSVKRRGTLVDKSAAQRSSYRGTEVFVSFAPDEERLQNAYQFTADLIVTNRDLPLLLPPGIEFTANINFITGGGAFVSPPTRPGLPLINRGSRVDYVRLSHIVLNLSAVLWQEGRRPLEMFKEILRAYQIRSQEESDKMILGLTNMESESVSFTFIKNGMVFFEWGWKVRFTLDEIAFTGMSYYMFGCMIAEMLKSFVAVNTLLEIEFFTEQSGHIATWKTFEE
jgi:type VI secretion system VasI/ImpG family protein